MCGYVVRGLEDCNVMYSGLEALPINQSIIRFVLRHSTTVLMAQDNVITTGKKDVSSIMI